MTTRSDLHALVDRVEDAKLEEARTRVEFLYSDDPLLKLLNEASYDDEPYTEEERREVEEAQQRMDQGEWVSWEELQRSIREERATRSGV